MPSTPGLQTQAWCSDVSASATSTRGFACCVFDYGRDLALGKSNRIRPQQREAPADASTLPSFAGGAMNSSRPRSAGVLLTRRTCCSSAGASAACSLRSGANMLLELLLSRLPAGSSHLMRWCRHTKHSLVHRCHELDSEGRAAGKAACSADSWPLNLLLAVTAARACRGEGSCERVRGAAG